MGGWGGWERNLKAVFMRVYCRLAANSLQKHVYKRQVSQNRLSRIVGLAEGSSPPATLARITFVYMYIAWHITQRLVIDLIYRYICL